MITRHALSRDLGSTAARLSVSAASRSVFSASTLPARPYAPQLASSQLYPKFEGVSQSVVKIDPEIMSGAPCFAGTRVPIQNLIDYLEGGESIEDFLDGFPGVKREQVVAVIEAAKLKMLETVGDAHPH